MFRQTALPLPARALRRALPRPSPFLSALTILLWLYVLLDPPGEGRFGDLLDRLARPADTAERPAVRPGDILSGPVTHVRDGDTIEVDGVPVRIGNLDCAEADSRAGNRASLRMQALIRGTDVTCVLTGRRSFDRQIGTCHLPSGIDLGAILIAEGYCARWR